jgi:acyl-CoA dehydrogenase
MTFSRRGLFTAEQEDFRLVIREFIEKEVVPSYPEWEKLGHAPREFFRKLGDIGVMGMAIPEEYGGSGNDDYRYNVILQEEASRAMVTLGTTRSQLDVWLPYFLKYCTPEQKGRWFPGMASGELLTAVAMTEPGTGSDLAGMAARAARDGDHYILNGAKTFITGGFLADLVIVVARTSDAPPDNRREGLSLLVVEDGMPGFVKGRMLEKIGLKVQDTAELSFSDVRVPVANLLGEEGKAFSYLGHNLPQERMTIAVGSVAQARAAVTAATDYARSRLVFGKELSSFQNTKFELAACLTEVEAAQALLDRALAELADGELSAADAAIVKLFTSEMQARVVDRALQIFGGYGYIMEYPIARLYTDARVTRIYGGTSEVMKLIISKSMGLLCELTALARWSPAGPPASASAPRGS